MRCPDCQKFVSYEGEEEPEVTAEPEVSGDAGSDYTAAYEVRCVKNCAECGAELKEATFDGEAELEGRVVREHWIAELRAENPDFADGEAEEWIDANPDGPEGHREIEAEIVDLAATEDTVTKDRHGKPIRNYRYMKTLYGYEGEIVFRCECGEELHRDTISEAIEASGFEELVKPCGQ